MKYKLLLFKNNTGDANDFQGNFTFFKKVDAVNCAVAWSEGTGNESHLWDGTSWTAYY